MQRRNIALTCLLLAALACGQWLSDLRLTYDPQASLTSYNNAWCVAVAGAGVHVVWHDRRGGNRLDDIYYKRSTDNGESWGSDTRLTIAAGSYCASVAVAGGTVHVVFYDVRDQNYEIYYKRSTDNGESWGNDTRLTDDASISGCPSVAVAGDTVHVAWHDNRDGNYEIYYKCSTDGGASWGNDIRLTNNTEDSRFSSVAAAGAGVHVVWHDDRDGNPEIYYKRSTDNGASWGDDIRLTDDAERSRQPSVAVAGAGVHVVWHDFRDGNMEIYYKRSTDGGASWGNDIRLTNNTEDSRFPSVAVAGAGVHVVWHDSRDGNYEIYYKRNPTGNPGVGEPGSGSTRGSFSIYPSPLAAGIATLRFGLPKAGPVAVTVFDIAGRCVLARSFDIRSSSFGLPLDLRALSSGVYLARLDADGCTATQKLVVQR